MELDKVYAPRLLYSRCLRLIARTIAERCGVPVCKGCHVEETRAACYDKNRKNT